MYAVASNMKQCRGLFKNQLQSTARKDVTSSNSNIDSSGVKMWPHFRQPEEKTSWHNFLKVWHLTTKKPQRDCKLLNRSNPQTWPLEKALLYVLNLETKRVWGEITGQYGKREEWLGEKNGREEKRCIPPEKINIKREEWVVLVTVDGQQDQIKSTSTWGRWLTNC